MSTPVPIKYADPSQETPEVQGIAADVKKVLTPNEEILYVAVQNITAITVAKDSAVATSNRLILFNSQVLGRASFQDYQWQDVVDVQVQQGMLSSELRVSTTDGRAGKVSNLDKEQAKRLYAICQQAEQEWREKRRIREMEEARARAGGVMLTMPGVPAQPEPQPAAAEDPVQKLARAKAMLDQGLISEAEYDTLKAKILSSM